MGNLKKYQTELEKIRSAYFKDGSQKALRRSFVKAIHLAERLSSERDEESSESYGLEGDIYDKAGSDAKRLNEEEQAYKAFRKAWKAYEKAEKIEDEEAREEIDLAKSRTEAGGGLKRLLTSHHYGSEVSRLKKKTEIARRNVALDKITEDMGFLRKNIIKRVKSKPAFILLGFSLLFLVPNITGEVISKGVKTGSSYIGAALFLLAMACFSIIIYRNRLIQKVDKKN